MEAEPVIKNGTTLVPLRIIGDKLGASVSWDSSTKTAIITQGGKTVSAAIGNSYITVDGSTVSTTAPTQIINSLTYVPLRAIASAFGAEVGYDAEAFSINDYHVIRTVWVQSRTDSPTVTEAEAVQKANNIFTEFLYANNDYITMNHETVSDFLNKSSYICQCQADLGEYYYIRFYDYIFDGVLIDKYDGSFYPVGSYSVVFLEIGEKGSYGLWSLDILQ